MQQAQKKINYCRLSLHGGILHRMEFSEEDRMEGSGGGYFACLAPVFDTADYDSTFHRFTIEGDFSDCKYEIIAAAVNRDISMVMLKEGLSPQQRAELLLECGHVRRVNQPDFLLHDLKGRFLWIYIGISASSLKSSFSIDRFQVEFPKSSFVDYLPEIYQIQKDTFFYRYMAALQSLYVDLEQEVGRIPIQLDYETAEEDNLGLLSSWAALDRLEFPFSPKQLRYLITNLQTIQAGKGTKKVLKLMLHLITQRPVYLVEYFKWRDWMEGSGSLTAEFSRLYGSDESVFAVILDFTGIKQEEIPESSSILRQIEKYTPLGMKCNLVYLRESCHMDTHCYLDINGCLSTPVMADTSGFMLGGNYILG